MARTPSTMLALGTAAPEFSLPDPRGGQYSLADFKDCKGVLIVFMCNHCPYVIHLQQALVAFANSYKDKGIAVIAINSNDTDNYPADAPDKMVEEAEREGYAFPYLFDATQAVAKAYHAACTPDFFLFDADHTLVYRGQFDASRPRNELPVTGEDMRRAADALLSNTSIPEAEQVPSLGCNIKWKPGNEPDYYG